MKRFFAKNTKNFSPRLENRRKFYSKRINLQEWSSQSPSRSPNLSPNCQKQKPKKEKKKTIQDVINHFINNPNMGRENSKTNQNEGTYQGNYKDDLSTLKNDSITVGSFQSRKCGHSKAKDDKNEPISEMSSMTPQQMKELNGSHITLNYSRQKIGRSSAKESFPTMGNLKRCRGLPRSKTYGGNPQFNTSLGKKETQSECMEGEEGLGESGKCGEAKTVDLEVERWRESTGKWRLNCKKLSLRKRIIFSRFRILMWGRRGRLGGTVGGTTLPILKLISTSRR